MFFPCRNLNLSKALVNLALLSLNDVTVEEIEAEMKEIWEQGFMD